MLNTESYRAIEINAFGGIDQLHYASKAVPIPGPGEALIAVRAAGVNPSDILMRQGVFGGALPRGLGSELSGVVLALGEVDRSWPHAPPAVADEVVAFGARAAYAELAILSQKKLAPRPPQVDVLSGAALSLPGQTALTSLDETSVEASDLVLIHGASGAVGSLLVQLALSRGARVIGTGGERSQAALARLGATPVLYGPGLAARVAEAADGAAVTVSIDAAGTPESGELGAAVQEAGGRAVTLVPASEASHGVRMIQAHMGRAYEARLLMGFASGELQLRTHAWPFSDVPGAHRAQEARHRQGKIVLTMDNNPFLPS